MPRPTLEIFTSDGGSVIGVATLAGIRIGEVGPFDTRDAVLDAAAREWPNIDHIDLPDAPDGPAGLADVPAAELPELLDVMVWDMSHGGTADLKAWRAELLARPDADSEDVQRAVAVIDEYRAPHGSQEALAAAKRAWPRSPRTQQERGDA